jgi:hypothetical protein
VQESHIDELKEILNNYREYCARTKQPLEAELKRATNRLRIALAETAEMIHEEACKQEDYIAHCRQKIIDAENALATFVEKTNFEWYVKHLCISDSEEFINPFTKKPLTSIEIDFPLLEKIDDFVDPVKAQIRAVEHHVHAYPPTLLEMPYEKVLQERVASGHFPEQKIPDVICVARIPDRNHFEVATHPILLDGKDIIDYARLKAYWESKSIIVAVANYVYPMSWHGYNPFTDKPCLSVEYVHPLKMATERFMKTLLNTPSLISAETAQNPNRDLFWFYGSPEKKIYTNAAVHEIPRPKKD